MRTNKIKMLLAFWWLIFYTNATAAMHPDSFESITAVNGLSDNTVYDILYGPKGYVWFLTDTGLNRYDGFHFRNFPLHEKENASQMFECALPHAIRKIYSDGKNLIYQLSTKDGLTCFDIDQERYLDIQFNNQSKTHEITGLYIADQTFIYFTTNEGLFCAEAKREDDNPNVLQVVWPENPLVKGNFSLLCGDNKRSLFFCKDGNQVLHYFMGTQKMNQIKPETNSGATVTTLDVYEDHLWIGRKWENLAIYDYQRETLRTFTDNSQGRIRIPDTFVTKVVRINDCLYYISTWSGLYKIEFDFGKICDSNYNIEYITQKECINGSGIENKMTSLLWDSTQQILWAGTFGGGALRLDFNKDFYSRILQQLNTEIQGIEEDSKGYVWLATERKGIWKSTDREISSSTTFVPWTRVSSTESYKMYKDKNGNFWLGDEHGGITYFDPLTDEVQHHQLSPTGVGAFSGNARSFCLDSRERLWIATTQGLILFDYRNRTSIMTVKLEGDIKEVSSVTEDKEGDIWIGTNIGVKLLDLQSGKAILKGDFEEQAGWPPCPVNSIYVNSNNQILVTYTDRMIRIDGREKNKIESVFTLENGLKSGHLLCMIDDYNGNTWIGSNSGIMTIRNDRNSLYNYSLTGYCNDVCRLRDGRLLWSDSRGLIYFDPMLAKNRPSLKHLFITDLLIGGKLVSVDEEINGQIILTSSPDHQRKFEFNSANNDFCFLLSDLQYSMMQRKITYRLLPDPEWHMCTLEEGIHFAGLSRGDYTLQVKLIYPDATEGNLLEIPFIIKGYWWLSPWAILCYLILAGGLGFVIYRHIQLKGKCPKAFPAVSAVQTSIEKASPCVEDENSPVHRLVITNLIKGLHTPLSMITPPLREALQEKGLSKGLSTKMLVAYRNSIGILNACEQLLSIYNYTAKKETELAPYSIEKVTNALLASMDEFLRVLPFEFKYENKLERDVETWVELKSFLLVLQNMLFNAFMHTNYTGAVALILQEEVEDGKHYCIISVVDNGKSEVYPIETINAKVLEKEQINATQVEIGYSMMEEIMAQHHGSVLLKHQKGTGTKIKIKFPIDKAEFEQDKNIKFIAPIKLEELLCQEPVIIPQLVDSEEEMFATEEQLAFVIPSRERKIILIIEDNKDIRLYLRTLFEHDYDVLLAVNGEEGVTLAKQEIPDLIISDIMMPVMDGYECCREIKADLSTCHIPVILLTAKVEDEDIIKGLEIGADDYILKPFTAPILKVKVKNLIENRINLRNTYTKLLVTPAEAESEEQGSNSSNVEIDDPFINTVVKIIEENIRESNFNVKKLASDLNMSQPTLYRKVKQGTGFTIIELIRGVRMRKAATLLKKKQYPVQEVAEMVGYNDIPTFRKHFIDTYGTTPSTYADSTATS